MSLLGIITLCFYGTGKLTNLINLDDTAHVEFSEPNNWQDEELHYKDTGFNIIALINWNDWEEINLEAYPNITEYVSIKAYKIESWWNEYGTYE